MSIIKELQWRGLLKQVTNEEKIIKAQNNHKGVYCGFDPTADSLHVGHLIQIINLMRFQKFGFKPIAVVGGATGMIGDPSFKKDERAFLTPEQLEFNVQSISKQLKGLIANITFENNASWLSNMTLIQFLRDVGKSFNLSYLLAKESIATRIETGLSVTEFSYTMLQAFDFFHLYKNNDCHVQIGGSDQWGNITSGIDYISSNLGKDQSLACGVTMNLLTKKDGTKFGKTESGAVWLDSTKTSEYEFYQFFLNQDDDDCQMLLRFLTMLDEVQINQLFEEHKLAPSKRLMQTKLAELMTEFVHGKNGLEKAQEISKAFFNGDILKLSSDTLKQAISSLPCQEAQKGISVLEALIKVGAASSNREVREFISQGAISINNEVLTDEKKILEDFPIIDKKFYIIKRGKRKYYVIIIK
ncbi:tyrosyl-tRNA synthetase [Spiroplasma sabaudiense Ar-1343]|uniref:Tyrosine--tRNA ligase n=1 Tax=Spiroplasma sabaudiense Ar-1343 TaxID=1276257 RepID=W6AB61_9MOLU|nr:tyrosine--tRNA ligase [Spiroplasma sabaudiense]AHI54095.1 tyrosyl-tRNA synthetase [Spiroplasma sabaudiense Ar-1343]